MDRRNLEEEVDREHVTLTGAHAEERPERQRRISVIPGATEDQAIIVVTEAYGPKGCSLVGLSDEEFSGFPAVTLGVRAGDREGLVLLSPIHGDRRKRGFTDIEEGARCELFCPTCKSPLDRVGEVDDGTGAAYYAIYLTKKLDQGSMVMISDIWGHFHSRIVDDMELISYWAATHSDA